MALCPSVCLCLSVTSRSSVKTVERIELVFGMGGFFHISYTVLKEIQVSLKIRVLPSGTFSYTPDLEMCFSIIDRRNVLST